MRFIKYDIYIYIYVRKIMKVCKVMLNMYINI